MSEELAPETAQKLKTPTPRQMLPSLILGACSALVAIGVLFGLSYYLTNRSNNSQNTTVTTSSGLQYIDLLLGTGEIAKPGQMVQVHYTGTFENGAKFDSSYDRGQPFSFPLGAGRVIKGWDEGVAGMRVGGKRKLIIPPNLGYGDRPMARIPANSTLIFEVALLKISQPGEHGGESTIW